MRAALSAWLRRPAAPPPPIEQSLAAAVLLVELARADFQQDDIEQDLIRRILSEAFALTPEQAAQLLQQATEHVQTAVSLHDFIATLNRQLDVGEKERLIGWLWQLAHADGQVDAREEALIRQLADWLHVRQAFVRQRLQVAGI